MQKKKSSFQVIPNYGVSGIQNWNESKEVPAEQGWNDHSLRKLLPQLQAWSAGLIAIAKPSRVIATCAKFQNLHEIGAAQ
jgi:hypothetical protein